MEFVSQSVGKKRRARKSYARKSVCAALKGRRKRGAKLQKSVRQREENVGKKNHATARRVPPTVKATASAASQVSFASSAEPSHVSYALYS